MTAAVLATAIFAAAAAPAAPTPPVQAPTAGDMPAELAALTAAPVFAENATAREMVEGCRAMIPQKVVVHGHINRRSRHGTKVAAYSYKLTRENGETSLSVTDSGNKTFEVEKGGRLLDTDVTWSDITMDYLWWDDVSFDKETEEKSVQGILCRVLLLKDGDRAVRVWIDRRTGAMLQAEELIDGKVKRELFCTSLKKFGERWAPKHIEVGPPGAKYRTKIVVDILDCDS